MLKRCCHQLGAYMSSYGSSCTCQIVPDMMVVTKWKQSNMYWHAGPAAVATTCSSDLSSEDTIHSWCNVRVKIASSQCWKMTNCKTRRVWLRPYIFGHTEPNDIEILATDGSNQGDSNDTSHMARCGCYDRTMGSERWILVSSLSEKWYDGDGHSTYRRTYEMPPSKLHRNHDERFFVHKKWGRCLSDGGATVQNKSHRPKTVNDGLIYHIPSFPL